MAATVKATKTAAKTAPKRRPARTPPTSPAPVEETPESGFEVLRLTTRSTPEERVPLFYIDDREYTIPKRPRMNVALQFMHLARERNDSAAMDYLLEKLLGEEGYKALRDYDDLTSEQFQQITDVATRLTLGALELPKE